MKQSRLHSNPRPRSGMSTRRQPLSKASPDQRAKVAEQTRCIACPNVAPFVPIDPAHLAARGYRGGCNDALCVVGICRYCHRAFDDGKLDLSTIVSGPSFIDELQHMLAHYDGDWVAMGERLTGQKVLVLEYDEAARLGLQVGALKTMRGWFPSEPGSHTAREHGCTCPEQEPVPIAGGGCAYARSEDCPLHTLEGTSGAFARPRADGGRFTPLGLRRVDDEGNGDEPTGSLGRG